MEPDAETTFGVEPIDLNSVITIIPSVLWFFLIVFLIWRFRTGLDEVFTALSTRISGGNAVKFGPLELSEFVRPSSEQERELKHQEELVEITAPTDQATLLLSKAPREDFLAKAHLAEQISLKKIGVEFETDLLNSVKVGSSRFSFDGFFESRKYLNFVEVKYSSRPPHLSLIQAGWMRLSESIRLAIGGVPGSKNPRVIWVSVVDSSKDVPAAELTLTRFANSLEKESIEFLFRVYSLE